MSETKKGRLRWRKKTFKVFSRTECKYVLTDGVSEFATVSKPTRFEGWRWYAGATGVPYSRDEALLPLDIDAAKAAAMAYVKECLAAQPKGGE